MLRSQPTAVPITVFQPDCVRQKCDDRQGQQEHVLKQSSFVTKPTGPSKIKCASTVQNQTDKILNLTSELRDRQRKRLTSVSFEAFDRDEAYNRGSTVLADGYQRVASSTLVKVDYTRGRLRSLENKIAGMRDNLLRATKHHNSPILIELRALEEEKRDEENELYSTIFDLQVLKDANVEEGSTTNELMESMENEIIALTTDNERLEQQVSEHKRTIEFSNAVIIAQETAFTKALQTKDDEIMELLEHIDHVTSVEKIPSEFVNELADLQLSLKDVETAKVKLETAFASLHDLFRVMEMEKSEREEKVDERERVVYKQKSSTKDTVVASNLPNMLLDEDNEDKMGVLAAELDAARFKLDSAAATQIRLEAENASLEKGAVQTMQHVDQLNAMRQSEAVLASNTKLDQEARIADMTSAILELQSARCANDVLTATQYKMYADAMIELNHTKRVQETERVLYKNAIALLEKEHENATKAASCSAEVTKSKLEADNAVLQQRLQLMQRVKNEGETRRQIVDVANLQTVSNLQKENGALMAQVSKLHEDLQKASCSAAISKSKIEAEVALLQQNLQIANTEMHGIESMRQMDCSNASQSISDLQAQNCILEARTTGLQVELEKVRSSAEASVSKLALLEHLIQAKKDEHGVSAASTQSDDAIASQSDSDYKRKYGVLDRIHDLQIELLEGHSSTETLVLKTQGVEEEDLLKQSVVITEIDKERAKSSNQALSSQAISNRKHIDEMFIVRIKELGLSLHWFQSARKTNLAFKVILDRKCADAMRELRKVPLISTGTYEKDETLVVVKKEEDTSTNGDSKKITLEGKRMLEDCVRALGFLGFYVPDDAADVRDSDCEAAVAAATMLSIESRAVRDEKTRSLACIAELAFLFL